MTPILAGIIAGTIMYFFTYIHHARSDIDDEFDIKQGIMYSLVASVVAGGLVYVGNISEEAEEILTKPFESY